MSSRRSSSGRQSAESHVEAPSVHASGAQPPSIPADLIPRHVAIVTDGNGRWAQDRGLPRTRGHEMGEYALLDVVHGAIELGVKWVSVYSFSTENWKRSPEEVAFLMNLVREGIKRRRDELNRLGVRFRWAGRRQRLWQGVIDEFQAAEELTRNNSTLTLTVCENYGGRAEIADAAAALARDALEGKVNPDRIDERVFARYLYKPDMPDVDLLLRTSGEQRTSNFLPWQSVYAELVFLPVLWPDVDRRTLWEACEIYASRDRRYGAAVPTGEG